MSPAPLELPRVRDVAKGGRMVRQISFDCGTTWIDVPDNLEPSPAGCPDALHEWMKSNLLVFQATTERPKHISEETYVGSDTARRWLRVCRFCRRTLAVRLNEV